MCLLSHVRQCRVLQGQAAGWRQQVQQARLQRLQPTTRSAPPPRTSCTLILL